MAFDHRSVIPLLILAVVGCATTRRAEPAQAFVVLTVDPRDSVLIPNVAVTLSDALGIRSVKPSSFRADYPMTLPLAVADTGTLRISFAWQREPVNDIDSIALNLEIRRGYRWTVGMIRNERSFWSCGFCCAGETSTSLPPRLHRSAAANWPSAQTLLVYWSGGPPSKQGACL